MAPLTVGGGRLEVGGSGLLSQVSKLPGRRGHGVTKGCSALVRRIVSLRITATASSIKHSKWKHFVSSGGDCWGERGVGQSCEPSLGARYPLCRSAHAPALIVGGLQSNQSLRAALLLTWVDKHRLSVSSLMGMKDVKSGRFSLWGNYCNDFGGRGRGFRHLLNLHGSSVIVFSCDRKYLQSLSKAGVSNIGAVGQNRTTGGFNLVKKTLYVKLYLIK